MRPKHDDSLYGCVMLYQRLALGCIKYGDETLSLLRDNLNYFVRFINRIFRQRNCNCSWMIGHSKQSVVYIHIEGIAKRKITILRNVLSYLLFSFFYNVYLDIACVEIFTRVL